MRKFTYLLLAGAFAAPAHAQTPTPGWPTCVERTKPATAGIDAVGRTRAGRVVTLTVASKALARRQRVTVVLPRGYDPDRRYAVLYALHGAGGDERTWVEDYRAVTAFAGLPVIVVAPAGSAEDAGGTRRNGGYMDWFGTAKGEPGPAFAWETFHVRELVPFIDRTFRTIRGPAGRAVVGISMGGGGLRYAAKHPGLFGYAGSLSGAVAPPPLGRDCQLGDPALHPILWYGENAVELAPNLRGVRLFLRTGDGTTGPLDDAGDPLLAQRSRTESLAAAGQKLLLDALRRARVTGVDAETYAGTHQAAYWNREIPEFAAWLERELRDPVRTRTRFRVTSVRERFTAWGWTFRARRRVRELAVVDVDGSRVTARGSGRLEVTAPSGRRTTLDLGPSHTTEQRDTEEMSGWRTASTRLR